MKASDKGIFIRDTETLVDPGATEEDLFAAAALPRIPPDLRDNSGKFEAAAAGRLPRRVCADDLRGDLHRHTLASDARGTAEDKACAALALGPEYLTITDHTQHLAAARGLDEARLLAQQRHLAEVQDCVGGLRLLSGTEVDLLPDGSLDLDLLRGLDGVVASVHSATVHSGAECTGGLVAAMPAGTAYEARGSPCRCAALPLAAWSPPHPIPRPNGPTTSPRAPPTRTHHLSETKEAWTR